MPSLISRTVCASRLPRVGRRPRRSAELRARRPRRLAIAGRSSLRECQSRPNGKPQVTQAGDYRFFAGWRSEPFFFDVAGALNNLQFTGDDFFADKDICSIVLEVPNSVLGRKEVGLWVRTLIPANSVGGGWIQADRGARPNQTPFLAGEQNAAYLAGGPVDDARFVPVFAHALEHADGYTPDEATRVAETLLPDLLRYDPTLPASFPDNGRTLTDDVSDTFLAILPNGKVTEDKVGTHGDLLDEFPYLGPPHDQRPPFGSS